MKKWKWAQKIGLLQTFSMAYVWLDMTAQIFADASNFSKWRPKKGLNLLPLNHIITHHLAFLQLLEPLGGPSPPPPLEDDYLKSLKKLASASFS